MKRIYRSPTNKIFAGLCGGLAEYFSIDPLLIRFLTVLLFFFTGFIPVFIAYLIGWWIVPLRPLSMSVSTGKRLYRSTKDKKIAGVCGGLGEYGHFDSTILRLVLAFLCIITGVFPLMIAYIIAALIIPKRPYSE